jgi:hypothetical protein
VRTYQVARKRIGGIVLGLLAAGLLAASGCASPSDLELCQRFAELKNAGSPEADQLLEPAVPIPEAALSASEADRLGANLLLHQPVKVLTVRQLPPKAVTPARFVLELDGSMALDRMQVQTTDGSESQQRTYYNPDLIVEVRDGKIRGLKVTVRGGQ